jgi:hypothetical protein
LKFLPLLEIGYVLDLPTRKDCVIGKMLPPIFGSHRDSPKGLAGSFVRSFGFDGAKPLEFFIARKTPLKTFIGACYSFATFGDFIAEMPPGCAGLRGGVTEHRIEMRGDSA